MLLLEAGSFGDLDGLPLRMDHARASFQNFSPIASIARARNFGRLSYTLFLPSFVHNGDCVRARPSCYVGLAGDRLLRKQRSL